LRLLIAIIITGIQVWFPFKPEVQINDNQHSGSYSLEFNQEVYPTGFSVPLGVIVGLSQGISFDSSLKSLKFELRIKVLTSLVSIVSVQDIYPGIQTHPFLHSILLHLLERKNERQATIIAKSFSFIPYFSHSLELLLHELLEVNPINS